MRCTGTCNPINRNSGGVLYQPPCGRDAEPGFFTCAQHREQERSHRIRQALRRLARGTI